MQTSWKVISLGLLHPDAGASDDNTSPERRARALFGSSASRTIEIDFTRQPRAAELRITADHRVSVLDAWPIRVARVHSCLAELRDSQLAWILCSLLKRNSSAPT